MSNRCFALSENNRCKVLIVVKCPGTSCSFYKTRNGGESRRKANARLTSLDEVYQKHIAATYYRGNMPWLEGDDGYDS